MADVRPADSSPCRSGRRSAVEVDERAEVDDVRDLAPRRSCPGCRRSRIRSRSSPALLLEHRAARRPPDVGIRYRPEQRQNGTERLRWPGRLPLIS